MIEVDGHWSAIDIDTDSKVIITLPRGERLLPGLLSEFLFLYHFLNPLVTPGHLAKTDSITIRVVLRCVTA